MTQQPSASTPSASAQTLTIIRPDDWHIHLRDGAALARTVPDCARTFNRVICMPNLVPPVKTVTEALAYRERIMAHLPTYDGLARQFDPRMVLYLTDHTDPTEISKIKASSVVQAVKLYPAGATTNSHAGVSDLAKVYDVIAQMEEHGVPFLLHGEVTHDQIDIFDREQRFLDDVLAPLLQRFPKLRVVLEHITTADAAAFVSAQGSNVAATITPQHLLFNRNHMLVGGIRPHFTREPDGIIGTEMRSQRVVAEHRSRVRLIDGGDVLRMRRLQAVQRGQCGNRLLEPEEVCLQPTRGQR